MGDLLGEPNATYMIGVVAAGRGSSLDLAPEGRGGRFVARQRVSDQPDRGGPETDEQGATLGVPALVLINGLGANPEADAEADRAHREDVQMPGAQPGLM